MKRLKKFLDRPKTPLVVDRRFDIYFIIIWFTYVAWAISSAIEQIISVNSIFDNVYLFAWSGAVGTSALIAAIFAILGFIPTGMQRVAKEKVEMYALIILTGFVFVYPCVLLYNQFVLHTNFEFFISTFVLSLRYLIAPLYRIAHLWGRIKGNV